ncbi:hypothetical protein [Kibdelosporangium aridum]|uniref:hypothetical protein n=1 Tax=Kibdelosporangium aridum TaxID=2030 RepID=UPI0035EE7AF9
MIETVRNHVSETLYILTPEDVEETFEENEHPLGDIDRGSVENIKRAKNWWPAYAFTHLLHFLLEATGRLPTWQEFREFYTATNVGWRMLGQEAQARLELLEFEGVPHDIAKNALTWRVGNAYYGLVRDIYTLVHLRAFGVDARAHPLADALFRTDCWIGRHVLSIRVKNPEFASGVAGRKKSPEWLLKNAKPPFSFSTIELEPATEYGTVHLPEIGSVKERAGELAAMQHER